MADNRDERAKRIAAARRAKAEEKRRQKRRKKILHIVEGVLLLLVIAIAAVMLVRADRGGALRPAGTPEPTLEAASAFESTSEPTSEPTIEPTPTPEPTATPEPLPEIPVGLYAPDGDGVRHLLSVYQSKWTRGEDIDCFEVLVSQEATHSGKYYDICKACWGTLPDPYAMRIGYELRYTLDDGSEVSMTIRSPRDVQGENYVEVYLYDDVHNSGFYTHLNEAKMKDDTLMTSIKLTCGDDIARVETIYLGAFLYDRESLFDSEGRYTGPWKSEIEVRRKA